MLKAVKDFFFPPGNYKGQCTWQRNAKFQKKMNEVCKRSTFFDKKEEKNCLVLPKWEMLAKNLYMKHCHIIFFKDPCHLFIEYFSLEIEYACVISAFKLYCMGACS